VIKQIIIIDEDDRAKIIQGDDLITGGFRITDVNQISSIVTLEDDYESPLSDGSTDCTVTMIWEYRSSMKIGDEVGTSFNMIMWED